MPPKFALLASALALSFAAPASATTIVSTLALLQAGAGTLVSSPNPGNYNTLSSVSPTTSTISLNDGSKLNLSNVAAVTSAPPGGFPYKLSDGFGGELFVPQDSNGNQLSTETISFSGVTALGFEVAPYSNALGAPYIGFAGGPYTISVAYSNGSTSTATLPGGSYATGTTQPQFFGFFGGGISSLTITTSDPNGLGFGNFYDISVPVPEPGTAALVVIGVAGLLRSRLRSAIA